MPILWSVWGLAGLARPHLAGYPNVCSRFSGDTGAMKEKGMDPTNSSSQPITTERLHSLRRATEKVSEYLYRQTETYLSALRPALVPYRLLGQYIEHPGKGTVTGADKAWSRLTAAYRRVAKKPFSIPTELQVPLAPIDPVVVLCPWEYTHEAATKSERETITVVCPAKWIVSYRSGFTPAQLRQALGSDQAGQKGRIQQFVINALVMGELLRSVSGIQELFAALRLTLGEETSPQTGALPFVTLTWAVASHLPANDIVLQTTRLSGVPRFTELIDPGSVQNLPDPLRDELQALIQSA